MEGGGSLRFGGAMLSCTCSFLAYFIPEKILVNH